jgi:phospholipase C
MLAAGAALSLVALQSSLSATSTASRPPLRGIRRIRHVIVIMEENRSFDNYFGTYPGADGIPMRNGRPAACLPDARTGRCVRPYLDDRLVDAGGPHDAPHARRDINGGRMNGFVRSAVRASRIGCGRNTLDPACRVRARRPDVMGYHDASTIPEYWRRWPGTTCSRITCSPPTWAGAFRCTRRWSRDGRPAAPAPPTR